jgi:peptide-methionine (S)-S-oxide reductase
MKISKFALLPAIAIILFSYCASKSETQTATKLQLPVLAVPAKVDLSGMSKATFAAGCFWCEEAVFESIKGVSEVISGYSGGDSENPTYEEVGSGRTGHAESVEVYYDSTIIHYADLVRVFFASEDPTQVNGQGPDHGSQYRSIIFYRNAQEQKIAVDYIAQMTNSGKFSKPIAAQVVPFKKFWTAEDYHQNYVVLNPGNPYVQHESIPRLRRTLEQVPDLIKSKK